MRGTKGKEDMRAIKELMQAADSARPTKYESPQAIMRRSAERAAKRIEQIFAERPAEEQRPTSN